MVTKDLPVSVYPPLEDSLLLAAVVREKALGKVLDMGCGSGIQSKAALEAKAKSVLGVDINPLAVRHCNDTITKTNKKAKFIQSDLFSKVPKTKFDTILFNPPYLPADGYPDDPATIGGKKGWETIERFLETAPSHLTPKGNIFLLFTSRTDKSKVHELIERSLLDWTMLATNHIAFETYYVYGLRKTFSRLDAERKRVTDIDYFSKGKRGWIFKGKIGKKEVALKIHNPKSEAIGRIENEARVLGMINKKRIGPKIIFSTEKVLCYDFAKGELIRDWLPGASRKATLEVLREVLRQCLVLDTLGIQKEEMHHPHKHIVVGKKVTLLDFERGHHTPRPHNVTQCCQYLSQLASVLESKKIFIDHTALRRRAENYSRFPDRKTFDAISALLG